MSAVLASAIGHSLSTMDCETLARMGRKFQLCFIMVKENISFAKYPVLLQLEEHHGVDVGSAYRTPDSAKSFTGPSIIKITPLLCCMYDMTGQLVLCQTKLVFGPTFV